jgi:hypothetical protein
MISSKHNSFCLLFLQDKESLLFSVNRWPDSNMGLHGPMSRSPHYHADDCSSARGRRDLKVLMVRWRFKTANPGAV